MWCVCFVYFFRVHFYVFMRYFACISALLNSALRKMRASGSFLRASHLTARSSASAFEEGEKIKSHKTRRSILQTLIYGAHQIRHIVPPWIAIAPLASSYKFRHFTDFCIPNPTTDSPHPTSKIRNARHAFYELRCLSPYAQHKYSH